MAYTPWGILSSQTDYTPGGISCQTGRRLERLAIDEDLVKFEDSMGSLY